MGAAGVSRALLLGVSNDSFARLTAQGDDNRVKPRSHDIFGFFRSWDFDIAITPQIYWAVAFNQVAPDCRHDCYFTTRTTALTARFEFVVLRASTLW